MCTLLLLRDVVPGAPVVLAANRDEFLARSWDPPRVHPGLAGDPPRLHPTDREAGGTWVGLNAQGVAVAVTNRMGVKREENRRSRGLLALDALKASSHQAAVAAVVAALRSEPYNGINILVFDTHGASVVTYGAGDWVVRHLDPGAHVVTSSHDLNPAMLDSLRDRTQELGQGVNPDQLTGLQPILADTRRYPDGYAVCKHMGGYGTVSSSLIALGTEGGSRFLFAPGPPDGVEFASVGQGGLARSS